MSGSSMRFTGEMPSRFHQNWRSPKKSNLSCLRPVLPYHVFDGVELRFRLSSVNLKHIQVTIPTVTCGIKLTGKSHVCPRHRLQRFNGKFGDETGIVSVGRWWKIGIKVPLGNPYR